MFDKPHKSASMGARGSRLLSRPHYLAGLIATSRVPIVANIGLPSVINLFKISLALQVIGIGIKNQINRKVKYLLVGLAGLGVRT